MAAKPFCIFSLLIIFFTLTTITSARPSIYHSIKPHKPTLAKLSTSHSIKTQNPISEIPSISLSMETQKPSLEIPSNSKSMKTHKPSQQHYQDIIESLMGAGDFSNWAVVLSTADSSNFPTSATLFIPSDNALSNITSSQFLQFDSLTLSYHVVPQKLSFSLLQNIKIGSRIPTLIPNKTILVTNDSYSNYTIDDSPITHPDLYINGDIAVHGIGSLLNYSVFGGGFDQDHQHSNPSSPEDDDEQSPESFGVVTNRKKPMGLVQSDGWDLRYARQLVFILLLISYLMKEPVVVLISVVLGILVQFFSVICYLFYR